MEKYLILKAVEHNWDMLGPGSWETITWSIFSDGSYKIREKRIPRHTAEKALEIIHSTGNFEEYKRIIRKREYTTLSGYMKEDSFFTLKKYLEANQWRDPSIDCYACDGVAWTFEYFDSDGKTIKTSGKLGYIYGHSTLENIAAILPSIRNYGANAFVSVTKKQQLE